MFQSAFIQHSHHYISNHYINSIHSKKSTNLSSLHTSFPFKYTIIIGGFNILSNMTIPRRDTNNIKFFPFILYITNTSFPYNPIQTSITSYTSLNIQQWKRGWKRQWTREGIIILPDTISIHNYNTNTTQLKYHTTTNIPHLSIILYPTSNYIINITQITTTTTHNTNNN